MENEGILNDDIIWYNTRQRLLYEIYKNELHNKNKLNESNKKVSLNFNKEKEQMILLKLLVKD